jgi:predicted aldo/keto reductase-like oxidoreductase
MLRRCTAPSAPCSSAGVVPALDRTGVKVSSYRLGAMMFGRMGNSDHDDSSKVIRKALHAGINDIDTSEPTLATSPRKSLSKASKGRCSEAPRRVRRPTGLSGWPR